MKKEYVFKVINFEAGQRKPYGDSFYHYEVTSNRPYDEVKNFCMNVLIKSYPRNEMPNPFAGEFVEFKRLTNHNEGRKFLDKRKEDTYRYKMKTMYTG
jgi:hypothetical protein